MTGAQTRALDRPEVGTAPTVLPPVQRVRGTHDYLPPHETRLRALERRLRATFESFGYGGIETPILEPLDLFLRKSGDEIVARMYAFSHWNRRLCLRPEITASVMRAYVASLQGQSLPVRLHYSGPAFRYERPSRGRDRQFTQVGVELIGAGGAAADAEVLHLARAGLEDAGIARYRVVVGHLGAVLQLLAQLGLSEHAQSLILDQMEPLAHGRVDRQAAIDRVVSLLGGTDASGDDSEPREDLHDVLSEMEPDQATAVAADILRRARLPLEGGVRAPRRIIQRLLAKASRVDPTEQVTAVVDFVLALRDAAAGPEGVRGMRHLLASRGLSTAPLDEVENALEYARAYSAAAVSVDQAWEVDLSLARGLRYYTGLVFEIYADTREGPLQVCGGGRYDDLVRALGGSEAAPACGFSFGLERLDLVRQECGLGSSDIGALPPRVLVVGLSADDHPAAVAIAADLRREGGITVEQDVRLRGPRAALRHADRTGARVTVLVGAREREDGVVVVRDLVTRAEQRVPREDAPEAVRAVLARGSAPTSA